MAENRFYQLHIHCSEMKRLSPLGIHVVNVSSLATGLRNKFCPGAAKISPLASNSRFSDVYLTPAETLMRSVRSVEAFFDDGD